MEPDDASARPSERSSETDDDLSQPADWAEAEAGDETEGDAGAGEKTSSHKTYATILDQEIREGVDELERPARGLFVSGVSAGLDIGFSVLAIGVLESLMGDEASDLTRTVVLANAYTIGFILVIFGRSELFTEHTTMAVLPLLGGQTTIGRVNRAWCLIYLGNLVGVAIFSAVLSLAGPALGSLEPHVLDVAAAHLVEPPWWVILLSAVLAGWLMGLVSWLVTAGRDTTSQILFVWLVTGLIGLAGLHHCILGSGEVLSAVLMGASIPLGACLHFLLFATLGNAMGGFFFVAIVKYGHASVVRPGLRDPLTWHHRSGDRRT